MREIGAIMARQYRRARRHDGDDDHAELDLFGQNERERGDSGHGPTPPLTLVRGIAVRPHRRRLAFAITRFSAAF